MDGQDDTKIEIEDEEPELYCDACKKTYGNKQGFWQHIKSKAHRKNIIETDYLTQKLSQKQMLHLKKTALAEIYVLQLRRLLLEAGIEKLDQEKKIENDQREESKQMKEEVQVD